jgi:hypothetical protein
VSPRTTPFVAATSLVKKLPEFGYVFGWNDHLSAEGRQNMTIKGSSFAGLLLTTVSCFQREWE